MSLSLGPSPSSKPKPKPGPNVIAAAQGDSLRRPRHARGDGARWLGARDS